MDCKPTSCGKARGFTIVEYLFASGIGVLVLGAAVVFWAYSGRTTATLTSYVTLSNSSKQALDTISKQVRNARKVTKCSATELRIIEPDGTEARYVYDGGANQLWRIKGTVRQLMLSQCSSFSFSVYQRTPTSNSFVLLTNGWNTNTAKVVQMKWTCYRNVTGDKKALENQVSAKVVLRNI